MVDDSTQPSGANDTAGVDHTAMVPLPYPLLHWGREERVPIQINGYDLPTYVSYSALSTWLDCGWQYYLTRLVKEEERPSWWLVGGSAVHLATETFDNELLTHGTFNDNWNELFAQAWATELQATVETSTVDSSTWKAASAGKEDADWWHKQGPKMVERWAAWSTSNNDWQIWHTPEGQPAVELDLMMMLGGVPVKMIIDRIMVNSHGELMVLDIKTGANAPKHDLQLAFYAAGIETMFGERPRWGSYWMGRTGSTTPLVDLSNLSTEKIVAIVRSFEKARHQEIFVPNLSSCKLCGVKAACHWQAPTMEGK